ncbi:nitrogen fixation protein NifQ [Pseudogulbenkiania subflava]|uniref:Nitrogen fixation protein NifQ n=1 Tax=Pseudogulbenkiania subflava DSM 22618 TaxID=1123014 RepID=A0A1Y6BA97_9NEIS|nr:nitrogen fixation protein NifQ [Pseudogulbenkiania subflava]SME99223.1 nitrogen fixation protein NifQ [Pseudogulbenkiania subflava DSM 22618]
MSALSPSTATVPPVPRDESALLDRAIAGVLRHAQDGDLPLFAWTLGLPQPALLAMLAQRFPELDRLEPMPEPDYASVRAATPAGFAELVALLGAHRAPDVPEAEAEWLAHAVAAACFGERPLSEDLGLSGREAVSRLLERYFPSLSRRNPARRSWKPFLFAELAAARAATATPGDAAGPGQQRGFSDSDRRGR